MTTPRPGIRAVRIRKGPTVFNVHGDLAGQEGVWLGAGQVHNLYEALVKTTWKTGAFQQGGRLKGVKWLAKDCNLGFLIRDTTSAYELNDSLFRQCFDYQPDPYDPNPAPTTIEVETDLSGVRKLDVLMYEQPDFDPDIDPLINQFGNAIFKLRAGQPFFYQDDAVSTFTDTAAAAAGFVIAENPTDQICYQKWVLTRGTFTLPDVQLLGAPGSRAPSGPYATRSISGITVTDANGGAVIDLDGQQLMFRDANNTNILAQMAGKFFQFPIPPYTPPTELAVSYTGAPSGGASIQLVMPRHWTRPWGMELPPGPGTAPLPMPVTFSGPAYSYHLPPFCDTVDYVLLGGGGGGNAAGVHGVGGGGPGQWLTGTLHRGTDIPWASDVISGSIGQGGAPGVNGTATTATWAGLSTPLSAPGGVNSVGPTYHGMSPGTQTLGGRTYVGGAEQPNYWGAGNPPGGGGATSFGLALTAGGPGANGQAWFYAYQS